MTINSTTRKTSALVGNGNTHTYPFAFKVFTDADVVVKKIRSKYKYRNYVNYRC